MFEAVFWPEVHPRPLTHKAWGWFGSSGLVMLRKSDHPAGNRVARLLVYPKSSQLLKKVSICFIITITTIMLYDVCVQGEVK